MVGAIAWILLWAMLIALAALALLVALPVRLFIHAQTGKPSQFVARVGVLGGIVPAITLVGRDPKGASEAKTRRKAEKKAKKKAEKRQRKPAGAASHGPPAKAWLRGVPQLLGDLLGEIHIENFQAQLIFGFEDPSDTGAMFGFLTPWMYGLASQGQISLQAQPDFGQARLDGVVDATIEVTPGKLIRPILVFVWSAFGRSAR